MELCFFILLLFVFVFNDQAFGCIDQDRDGVIKKQDLKETYAQLGMMMMMKIMTTTMIIMMRMMMVSSQEN